MGKTTVKIKPEIESVLRASSVEGDILRLPGQLDRKTYTDVNKVIELLGGKWNKGKGGHVFPTPFADILDAALDGGEVVDKKKQFQLFETPAALAEELAVRLNLYGLGVDDAVLEPSAGKGRLLYAIRHELVDNPRLDFCEIQPDLAAALKVDGFNQVGEDFLKFKPESKYQRILMNPPFTNGQDVDHVMHAYNHCLADGGKLIAIMAPAFTFREQRKYADFRELLSRNGVVPEELPEGTFKESGTGIRTIVVELNKHRTE